MSDTKISDVSESIMAGQMLSISASRVSTELLTFSGWLTTAFGVAFALLIANISTFSTYVSIPRLKFAVLIYLFGIILHVGQRALGAVISAAAAAGSEGGKLGAASVKRGDEPRFPIIFKHVEESTYWPTRWLLRSAFAKILAGDLSIGGRTVYKMAQWQAYAALVQALLSVAAAAVIALGLKV